MSEYSVVLDRGNSSAFEPLECVNLLKTHSENIGVLFFLVQKLRSFKYEDVEFLIPQLLQILVTFETNSMSLQEFILDYSDKYPHFGLIVFWNLQVFIFELKDSPDSYSFRVVRNMVNKLQSILFNPYDKEVDSFKENLPPALILCGALAASMAIPTINKNTLPLVILQGKQSKSHVFKLANFLKSLTRNLTIKNRQLDETRVVHSDDEHSRIAPSGARKMKSRYSESSTGQKRRLISSTVPEDSDYNTSDDDDSHNISSELMKEIHNLDNLLSYDSGSKFWDAEVAKTYNYGVSSSMPDLSATHHEASKSLSTSKLSLNEPNAKLKSNERSKTSTVTGSPERTLKNIYFKGVTEFILALQNVSLRLSQLPKEARLSALRAELTIINDKTLPAAIDIPQLLPVTSTRKKFHKLLKLSINDACVLNSAERVPFLLFVEFLSDELDFNPVSRSNQQLLMHALKRASSQATNLKSSLDASLVASESQSSGDTMQQMEADLSDMRISLPIVARRDLQSFQKLSVNTKSSHKLSQNDINVKNRADQMRIAAVMLQQLEDSGQAMSEQTAAIKDRIVQSMIALQDQFDSINFDKVNNLTGEGLNAGERKLENDFKLAEDWKTKKNRIRAMSPYGHMPNWDLCSVIVKNGSDLPQEAFACQLIALISKIWYNKGISFWTKRMKILITSANTGLVETITNAISIHSIKKSLTERSVVEDENAKRKIFSLKDYFEDVFGDVGSKTYRKAQENFTRSLASYSIICYFLQIKDRHNGNIMIDSEGHIIHIDFGFLLSNSPGSVGFEAAPFKLTSEYIEIMGGIDSDHFQKFKQICSDCFLALRDESDQIINVVELMQKDSTLPCFNNGENTSVLLRQRLQLHLSQDEVVDFVENVLIGKSLGSMYTRLYDQFQLITQGIYN